MKYMVATCMLIIGTVAAQAQSPNGLNQEHMDMLKKLQNMSPEEQAKFMQQMQGNAMKAQSCMGNVDQAKMQEIQAKGEALSKQIDVLCAQGKEKEAERYAMREGKKMMNDPTVKKVRSCSKYVLKNMDFLYPEGGGAGKKGSICDK